MFEKVSGGRASPRAGARNEQARRQAGDSRSFCHILAHVLLVAREDARPPLRDASGFFGCLSLHGRCAAWLCGCVVVPKAQNRIAWGNAPGTGPVNATRPEGAPQSAIKLWCPYRAHILSPLGPGALPQAIIATSLRDSFLTIPTSAWNSSTPWGPVLRNCQSLQSDLRHR